MKYETKTRRDGVSHRQRRRLKAPAQFPPRCCPCSWDVSSLVITIGDRTFVSSRNDDGTFTFPPEALL